MKTLTKVLSVLLALIMVLSCIPFAFALEGEPEQAETDKSFSAFSKSEGAKKETFKEFDFENVWMMSNSCSAPELNYEVKQNKLMEVKIVSIPLKNRVVFTNGSPESPKGIKVKLIYEDGSEYAEEITETENGYYAGNELLFLPVNIDAVRYGILTTALYFREGEITASYKYLSLPKWLDFLFFFGF